MYLILDFGVQIGSIDRPIKRNSVGPGNMCHCGTPSFKNHLDYCLFVHKHIQQSSLMRRLDVWGNNQCYSARWSSLEIFDSCQWQRVSPVSQESESCFQGQKQSDPINRKQESRLISIQRPKRWFSDSVELCETEVCFLHMQLIGTNVWLPKTNNVPPEVDFDCSRSPAKSESWNSTSLHCFAILPTKQYCLYSHVWWMYVIYRSKRFVTSFGPFCDWSCKLIHRP